MIHTFLSLGIPLIFTIVVIFLGWLEFHHYAGRENDSDKGNENDLQS